MAAYIGVDVSHANNNLLPSSVLIQEEQVLQQQNFQAMYGNNSTNEEQGVDQVTDWRVLDKFVASQLSQDASKDNNNYSNAGNIFHGTDINSNLHLDKQEMVPENASTSNSSCPIDLWK